MGFWKSGARRGRAVDDAVAGGRTARPARLAALAALACSLALALGASAVAAVAGGGAEDAARSADGSTVGIFVENAPSAEDVESGRFQGNDSNLGIFVTSDASEDNPVAFWSQGVRRHEVPVSYGALVSPPAAVPEWEGPWDGEDDDPPAPKPVFAAWCVDAEGTVAYDFSRPVTAPLDLYAGWNLGTKVNVELRGLGGTMEDPEDGGRVEDLTIARYAGSTYRTLPTPEKAGHTFRGWHTKDGRASGDWGVLVKAATPVSDVSEADHALYAKWEANAYRVTYVNNVDGSGGGRTYEVAAVYGVPGAFLTWDEAEAAAEFYAPAGKRFAGWNERADGSGAAHAGGDAMLSLTAEPDDNVALYAQWVDDGTIDPGPFDVRFVYHDGATEDAVASVERGERVDEPETPKRPGWQFAGWYTDEALTHAWSFDAPVMRDWTLHAKWDLRLDVTVPVSVGFAVDADTGEATGPDEDRYALKSRTVAPVVVERAALESRQDELEGFFELRGAAAGGADAGEGSADESDDAWAAALADTRLSLGAGGETVSLPFAGEAGTADGAKAWKSARELTDDERAAFRMDAFAYGGTPADEAWQGGLPCEELPLKLGLTIPVDKLKAKTAVDGPQKVTRLILTVSAKA